LGALSVAVVFAYARSFSAPFVFDDIPSIVDHPSLRHLWPPWSPLFPPAELGGMPVGGRPLVNFSLAVNYALGGTTPTGYHAINLLIHLLAGLTLFGLVRRTVVRNGHGADATLLAFAIAAVWLLHPLQVESVTYVSQRAESLMALCCLLTIYAFARGVAQPAPGRWFGISAVSCALGMACKEVMVATPLLVLFYDRTFVAGTFRGAWQSRRTYYVALAATWLLLAGLVAGNAHRGGTAGVAAGVTVRDYALTQFHAVATYLKLVGWPRSLVFDYGIETVTAPDAIAIPALLMVALLASTTLMLYWNRPAGFALFWFFALLAPTSSIVPIATQTMAEHRMYLPLAAAVAIAVLGLHVLVGRRAVIAVLAASLAFAVTTAARNGDFASALTLWTDTTQKYPASSRAHQNVAVSLFEAGRTEEALAQFHEALRLRPTYPEAHANLGYALLRLGRPADAAQEAAEALRLRSDLSDAHNTLGLALKQLGRPDDALREFTAAIQSQPAHVEAHNNRAISLLEAGHTAEAIVEFEVVLRLRPGYANAHGNLGVALMRAGDYAGARTHYEEALRLDPRAPNARENLAALRSHLGSATPAR
jgi:Flp pilus assembly protein TadD